MDNIGRQAMVVGIDGSLNSDAALAWAVDEASRRGLELHLFSAGVHRTQSADFAYNDASVDAAVAREALEVADAHLAAAVDFVLASAPGLTVTVSSSLDRAAGALVELSARAHSIVVGRSGHGPVLGAVLGSVALQVVTHAQCPVVVVHVADHHSARRKGVAVAVDGSAGSDLALAHGFEQASERGVQLHVIHAWWTRATAGQVPDTQADLITREQLMMAEAMAGWAEQYPDVEVRVSLPVGPTVLAITDEAGDAELLVVGSRGHGGFRSLLLGSISQGVLRHAACTVVVVRSRPGDPGASGNTSASRKTVVARRLARRIPSAWTPRPTHSSVEDSGW